MSHSDTLQLVPIEKVKKGEFVRKVRRCTGCRALGCSECSDLGYVAMDATYKRDEYLRPDHAFNFAGGYSLTDCEDVNRTVRCLKKGTLVLVGFTY